MHQGHKQHISMCHSTKEILHCTHTKTMSDSIHSGTNKNKQNEH